MKRQVSFLIAVIISLIMTLVGFTACEGDGYKVKYRTDGNGTIQGKADQQLEAGGRTSEVEAVPNEGYLFDKWSDDMYEPTRSDIVTDGDLTFTAHFKKCKYTLKYSVMGPGTIEGNANQTVEYGDNATTVTATPEKGYRFVRWLDTKDKNPVRTDTSVNCDIDAVAVFESVTFEVRIINYTTDGNGTIEGKTSQRVEYNCAAEPVKAVPNDGYKFVKWSDGVTNAERHDLNVKRNETITAKFERVFVRYKLNYKFGKTESDIKEFIFYDNNFKTVKFPVPTREHFTFGGWFIGERQVADTVGAMSMGNEILKCEEREIYAKWTANVNYTYKILVIFVTEIDATITSVKGNGDMHVYYKMSDFDLKICKNVTTLLNTHLNDMLDGLVTFEIDEYYTTVPVGTESINYLDTDNIIDAYDIPEINNLDILKNYWSVLTVFNMGDYSSEFHGDAGMATEKYGMVHLESVYTGCIINDEPVEYLLDVNFWRWNASIEPFLHELAHTIEMRIYGDKISYYHRTMMAKQFELISEYGYVDTVLLNKYYYLNEVENEGKKVGIPIEFWSGEMELKPVR